MTNKEIENYLLEIENKLINQNKRIKVELNREWIKQFPEKAGVYIFFEDEIISYVGETGNLKGRMGDILNTQNHNIRRNIGDKNFKENAKYVKASSNKKFPDEIEKLVESWMNEKISVSIIPLRLGRKELEERIYDKYNPKYNIKGKRNKYGS